MEWSDWTRYAQGYIIRNARYLEGVRKSAYFSLLAAGAKRVREHHLFTLITDNREVVKIDPSEKLSKKDLEPIIERYFGKKWPSQKKV